MHNIQNILIEQFRAALALAYPELQNDDTDIIEIVQTNNEKFGDYNATPR